MAAIGDGSSTNWELFQFAQATPFAPDLWELRTRLRGQCGTDGVIPTVWPVGSTFSLITPALRQLRISPEQVGLLRTYRIGPIDEGFASDEVVVRDEAFSAIGLRPYSVAHLRAMRADGALYLRWVRRTRIGGDRWEPRSVPLGEAGESYLLRVRVAGAVRREVETDAPRFAYSAAMQAQDGAQNGCVIEVAQISEQFGAGPFRSITVG
jgi:hypothetical protein